MQKFEIWIEGYQATGEKGTATKATEQPIEAETFSEAVAKHVATLPAENSRFWRQHEDGHWSMYACRTFPDEASARRSFC